MLTPRMRTAIRSGGGRADDMPGRRETKPKRQDDPAEHGDCSRRAGAVPQYPGLAGCPGARHRNPLGVRVKSGRCAAEWRRKHVRSRKMCRGRLAYLTSHGQGRVTPPAQPSRNWQKLLDQIQRPLFCFVKDTSKILADHAQCHELDAAEEENDGEKARVAGDRIAEQQGFHHDLRTVDRR